LFKSFGERFYEAKISISNSTATVMRVKNEIRN